ncbi:MAG: B12-binding domain-containing radical SAM protein [Planctomycetes bacterium]|nr:B12-binding domain-containing radical SAM protein [Planctomycetota bacterium]
MRDPPALPGPTANAPPERHRALLIQPFYRKDPNASFGKHVLTPSLALTSIAAATPPHWRIELWDENLLQGPPPADPIPQVVGISVHLTFARRAYELAAWYRARGARVILGGLHVLSCPDEARPHADALAIGEGVQTWPEILADVERGCLQAEYRGSFTTPHYAQDPAPARHLLPRRSFLTTSSLIATRGCHNRCGFCYLATDGLRVPYQMRSPAQIAAEFAADDQPYGVFTDNNLGSNRAFLHELCAALQPLQKIWSAAVTIDVTDDPASVRAMALAGCTGVFIGFESLHGPNLTAARKKTPAPDDYARRVGILHRHGIQVNGSFVFGFDGDDPDVFERTVRWIERVRLECATFHILTPYPGTPMFRELERQGRILHRDWDRYDTAHVVFAPARMSAERLQQGYEWCYDTLFSLGSIWRRRPTDRGAVPAYLAMSLLYKKANWLWPWLIRHRLVGPAWRPLVELSRRRHLRFRAALAASGPAGARAATVVSAGV